MNFQDLVNVIFELTDNPKNSFLFNTKSIIQIIEKLNKYELVEIVKEIGTIPEKIQASSSAEKLFSKASDCVLAKCFQELGLKSIAVNERSNSADIVAESLFHGYSLVADAKTFRLSRTAKNQKDFKIDTLNKWRGQEHDYAILVAPYFQYPNTSSQIYSSSLDSNVCLLSWEHILYLLNSNITETESFSFEPIWSAPTRISRDHRIAYADRMNCQFPYIDRMICDRLNRKIEDFALQLSLFKNNIYERSIVELSYLRLRKNEIKSYTREEAINELVKISKVNEKISKIESFVNSLRE